MLNLKQNLIMTNQKHFQPIDNNDISTLFSDERIFTICPNLKDGKLCVGMVQNDKDEKEIITLSLYFRNPFYKGIVFFTKNGDGTFDIRFEEGSKTIENVLSFEIVTTLIYEIKRVGICFN